MSQLSSNAPDRFPPFANAGREEQRYVDLPEELVSNIQVLDGYGLGGRQVVPVSPPCILNRHIRILYNDSQYHGMPYHFLFSETRSWEKDILLQHPCGGF